jgi:hypothetical protein
MPGMRRNRLLALTAVALGLLLTLTGCVKLDMDLTVRSNDTVDGTVIIAVDKALLTAAGLGQTQLRDQLEKQGPFPASERPKKGKFSQRPYDKDGKVGEAYIFSGVPLAEFGRGSNSSLKITHKGDRYFVTGVLDLTSNSAADPEQQALAKQAATSADLRIRLTFPGEVLKSNGDISGRSVTWHPKLGQQTALTAEARTTAVIPKLLAIVGGVAGLLLIIGLVVLFLLLRRRRRARAAYDQGPPGYPGPGYPGPGYPQPRYDSPFGQHAGGYAEQPQYAQPGGYASQPARLGQPPSWEGGAPVRPGGYGGTPPAHQGNYAPPPGQPVDHGPSPSGPTGGYGAQPSTQPGGHGEAPYAGPPGGQRPPVSDDRTIPLPTVDPTRPTPPEDSSGRR